MTSASETAPPRSIDLRAVVRGAAWVVVGAAAVRLIDGFLGGIPAAGALLGAFAVDLLASRAGARFSGDDDVTPWRRDLRTGLTRGATGALAVVVGGAAIGWAHVGLGSPGPTLAFALARVVAEAFRDVVLYVGLPVVLGRRAGVPAPALVAFSAAAVAVPLLAGGRADLPAVASAAALAVLGARLVLASGRMISAIAAQVGWLLVLGPLSRGGLLDTTWSVGDPGPPPRAEGAVAWVAVAVIVAIAALGAPRAEKAAA